jgi:hypothetical protein
MEYQANKLVFMIFGRIVRVNSLLTLLEFGAEIRHFANPKFLFLNPLAFSYFCKAF